MEIADFYIQAKKIGIPNKMIAGDIVTFVEDSRKGDELSLEEILKITKDMFPDGYEVPNITRDKVLHESFSDEDIKNQVARFKENAAQWGFPNNLTEDLVSEFLRTAKTLDAEPLDEILQYPDFGLE
jgi:hypothetical protein